MVPLCPDVAVLYKTVLRPVPGVTVTGTFHCKKSQENSRELEIDLEYRINCAGNEGEPQLVVQSFKVC